MPGPIFAETPVLSLNAVTSTGATGVVLDNVNARAHHSLFMVTSALGVTGGVATLELSNDNVNWFDTTTTVTATAPATAYFAALANSPAQYVRAKLTTGVVGTGTVSVYVASAGN